MRKQRLNLSGTKDSGSGRKHVMAWRLPRFFFGFKHPQRQRACATQCLLEEKESP